MADFRQGSGLFSANSKEKEPQGIAVAFPSYRLRTVFQKIYMKKITVSLLCLSALAVSAIAQDGVPADNTAKNQRDRSGDTQTSGDQSNNSPDLKTTAAIRRAVMADDSLSMTAKNVKIITAGDTVTLRGPVNTAEEKTKIEQLAQSVASNVKIDNQLEVKDAK